MCATYIIQIHVHVSFKIVICIFSLHLTKHEILLQDVNYTIPSMEQVHWVRKQFQESTFLFRYDHFYHIIIIKIKKIWLDLKNLSWPDSTVFSIKTWVRTVCKGWFLPLYRGFTVSSPLVRLAGGAGFLHCVPAILWWCVIGWCFCHLWFWNIL